MQVNAANVMAKIFVGLLPILTFGFAEAKLIAIALEELVRESTLIAYGKTVHPIQSDDSIVLFAPHQVLKGSSTGANPIPLCNSPDDVESFDLRKVSVGFVVFAAKSGACYRPVHGISSVIQVQNQIVNSLSIAGEPESQSLRTFLNKTSQIVKSQLSGSPPRP